MLNRIIAVVFFSLALMLFSNDYSINNAQISIESNRNLSETAKILRVVDGDTLKVFVENEQQTVRIIGINTPETVDPRKEVECFGVEASERAKTLLPVGSEVKLESDYSQGNTDRYGRLLRYVLLADGTDYGQQMISQGFANEYTYDSPYLHQERYRQAENEAISAKRGLWSENSCPKRKQ